MNDLRGVPRRRQNVAAHGKTCRVSAEPREAATTQAGDPMKLHGRGFLAVGLLLLFTHFLHSSLCTILFDSVFCLFSWMHHDMRMRMVPTTRDDDEENDALWLDALWQMLDCGRSWIVVDVALW